MSEPFLKWAGGKRWLVAGEHLPVPTDYRRYVEPFLGGAAVFFHLLPANALLSDINAELIELYIVVRDYPDDLQVILANHQLLHCHKHYYDVRASEPDTLVGRAARTLYLNRTCWNGLYRVNLRGEFNVPIGTKQTVIFEGEDFRKFSAALQGADLRCSDFATTISETGSGDFLFVDPPYTAQHNENGFLKYNERIFSWNDQLRLRDALVNAAARGVSIVLTNANHVSVRSLYGDSFEYRAVSRQSVLAANSDKRGPTTEALFAANI